MMGINGHGYHVGVRWTWPRFPQWAWWRLIWTNATRWFRPRAIVIAVNAERGMITVAVERWSWRRWRWERVASRIGGAA